ncbi:translocation protein SEC62-like [Tubulinosema ratisbonensis]|uniref:Translocation protein SEC62 n=1 Tax=Tubulinosema ratisbonensis TaxID=291195 RepID=A0A437AHS1_9MICR|nr:translocation protein SEC62-like [Tubulinosema ratisbonensis]
MNQSQKKINISKLESLLRKVETKEALLNGTKRVYYFKGSDGINILQTKYSQSDCVFLMNYLLDNDIIIKIKLNNDKEKLPSCKLNLIGNFSPNENFIFIKAPSNFYNLLISVLFLGLSLFLVMFKLWPANLKHYASYTSYPIIGFIIFLVVVAIIRLIFFIITFFFNPPGIWIFPNFFADVGFFESFVPLWERDGVDTKPKKDD